jgi:hypothetical protein
MTPHISSPFPSLSPSVNTSRSRTTTWIATVYLNISGKSVPTSSYASFSQKSCERQMTLGRTTNVHGTSIPL